MFLYQDFDRTVANVGSQTAAVRRFDARHVDAVSIQVKNTGAAALTACSIGVRATRGAYANENEHVTAQSSGFTTPTQLVPWASGDPTTLAPGASVVLTVWCSELESVELKLGCGTSTTVEVSGGGYGA